MNNPNTIHQIDIALVHLEKACELFFNHDCVCALTLAAAAEEVLGEIANRESKKLLGRQGKERGISSLNINAGIMEAFNGTDYIEYIKNKNKTKNSFKHATPDYQAKVEELELTVKQFIGDAITNYKLLSKELPKLTYIEKFCIEVGVS